MSSRGWDGPLPEPVRALVVAHADATLSDLRDDEVPSSLKPFRSWAAPRRTTRAATPLALALERDVAFRQRTFARVRTAMPELAEALVAGAPPAAADPVEVAAAAYLGRTPGWADLVAAAGAAADHAVEVARNRESAAELEALREELATARERTATEVTRLREQVERERAENERLTRALREERGLRRRAEREAAAAAAAADTARSQAADSVAAADARAQGAALRQADAEAALAAARRAVREGRDLESTRLRLLLDTVVEAAAGLRRELTLPPTGDRPADLVAGARPDEDLGTPAHRGLDSDDPALLDQLLALPQVHLVVDGYNVTKTGFPDLPLEAQRSRLVTGLSFLAARTGAEVTCCFDGAPLEGRVPASGARGVRVLFSRPGEIADELIRRLVRAEPAGRQVVVASSDREVVEGVRRAGARTVSAAALARRLDRG